MYPKTQIELAQLKIAAKQKEDAYKKSMADGLINVSSKSHETAIDNFNTALVAKPNDATAIRELENAKKLLAATKKPVANPLFAKYVAEADALFAGEKWLEAEKVYVKALAIDQTSSYVDKQIIACKEQLNIQGGIEEENAYQKIITTANKYAAEEKYDEAIGLLERAKKNRTRDPYPPIRIEEIKALKEKKNPTITSVPTKQIIKQEGVQEVNLANLGTQDALDVKAAQAELNKGATKRKYLRDKRVKNLEEKNKGFIASLDSTTTVKNNATSESIEQLNKQELIDAQDLNEDIRDNSEKIILEEKKSTAYNIQSATYENTDILNATKSVEALEIETNNNLYKGNELKDVNNEQIKTQTLIEQRVAFENDQNYIADGRNSEEILQAILLDNSKVDYDNGQLRKETAQQVEDLQKDVRSNETTAYTNEINSVQSAQEITDGYQKDGQTIFTDAEIKKMEMIDLMQAQEKSSAAYNRSADEKDNDINKVVEHELTERQLVDSKAFIDSDNGRLNNVESIKGVDVQYYEYNRIENEKEGVDLNNADKSLADLENEKLNGFTAEDKSIKASVVGVETEQQNQTNTYVVADQSKTANHYTNTESLDEVAKENAAISPANDKKLQENTDAITKEAKEADKVRTDAVLAKELEMQNTKIMLAKLESKEIRYDEKMANTLAQQFPEGVSQENFPRYDQEGIMVGQVTRRIVVIGNRGDVYLRYQSLAGITYQKNGQAITEYIWQSESQNGKLKRNY